MVEVHVQVVKKTVVVFIIIYNHSHTENNFKSFLGYLLYIYFYLHESSPVT